MRFKLFPIIAAFALGSCASQGPYGDHANLNDASNTKLSRDVTEKLASLYSPATTTFTVSQNTDDRLGAILIPMIRAKGYALSQVNSVDSDDELLSDHLPVYDKGQSPGQRRKPSGSPPEKLPGKYNSLALQYTVSNLGGDLYSIALNINNKTLSRVYIFSGNNLNPAGLWALKE